MHLTKLSIARVCGAAAALLALGCGSSSTTTAGGDPAAAIAGSWTFSSGSIQPMCNLSIAAVDLTGDTLMIVRVDSTHVTTSLNGNGVMCNVNFTVSAGASGTTTATAAAGQTCAVTVPVGTTSTAVTIDITSWTLAVSGDTLTNAMTGTATAAGILTCTPTADGTATRVAGGG